MAGNQVRVLIADDQRLFAEALEAILTTDGRIAVVGRAANGEEAVALARDDRPDVVLMDIAMPGMDGVLATREIGRRAPKARVLIVSAHDQVNDVLDALEAGAAGYALKSDGPETLIEAIRVVSRGQRYVAAALAPPRPPTPEP